MLVVTNCLETQGRGSCLQQCVWVGCWCVLTYHLASHVLGLWNRSGRSSGLSTPCYPCLCWVWSHSSSKVNTTQLFICLLCRERFTSFWSFLVSALMQSYYFSKKASPVLRINSRWASCFLWWHFIFIPGSAQPCASLSPSSIRTPGSDSPLCLLPLLHSNTWWTQSFLCLFQTSWFCEIF